MSYSRVAGLACTLTLFGGMARAEVAPAPIAYGYTGVSDPRIWSQGTFVLGSRSSLSYASNMFNDKADDLSLAVDIELMAAALDFLALGMQISTRANHHSIGVPAVSQTVGDPVMLLRGGYPLMDGLLTVGGELGVGLPTVGDGVGVAWEAISPAAKALLGVHAPFGVNGLLNLGLSWDRSETAFGDNTLDPVLRYSAQVANTPAIDLGLAVDYRLALLPWLSLSPYAVNTFVLPFLEVDTGAGMTGKIGGGVRLGLGEKDAVAVTAAADLAYLRPDPNKAAVPAVPPWSAMLGLAVAFDPFAKPTVEAAPAPPPEVEPKIVEKVVEVEPPKGRVKGIVLDSVSRAPIVDAILQIDGEESSPLSVNGADGTFLTYPLLAGRPYKFKVVANGYRVGELNAMINAGQDRSVEVTLDRSDVEQFGELRGIIKGASGEPVEASIVVTGLKGGRFTTDAATGAFSVKVPVGDHVIAVGAQGYTTQKKKLRIRPGDVVILNVDLAR